MLIVAVNEILILSLPFGTVGVRITFTKKPFFLKKDCNSKHFVSSPNIIGIICEFEEPVLIFILFASSSTNLIANYIPTQNIIINFMPKNMTLKKSGLTILFFGFFVGALWTPLLSQNGSLSILDTIASFFGPIFGIIIVDYYVIKKRILINKDIFFADEKSVYMYSKGWNLKALYSILIGTIFAFSTIWNPNLNIFQSFSWIIGFVVSSIVYYLLASEK